MVFKNFLSKAKDIDILSSLPDGILLVDNSGKVEWANDVAPVLFCVSKGEIIKSNFNDFVECGLDLAKQAADSLKPVVGRIKPQLEKELYVEITSKQIENYFVVSLRDVTQSYKTVTNIMAEHESSKKINRDKNTFLVKLSNELKSPIQSVIGFSQAMIDGLGGEMSDKQEKYIKIINKNSNEVLYLMNKIIELAKTESHLFDYTFQIFDVINLISTVMKEFEQPVKSKNLSFNLDIQEVDKKTIFSDEGILKIILQNILETSINSTDIGSISVKAFHPELDLVSQKNMEIPEEFTEKSYLMMTVADTGAGFADSDLKVIFEPYAQLDKANKKNIVKSIALACVRNLVRYLNGVIWIESEPMQGATYNVIIPIEKA